MRDKLQAVTTDNAGNMGTLLACLEGTCQKRGIKFSMRGTCQNSRLFRRETLNSSRVWSSQLKQTIARFEEKLATILIKIFPIAIGALTTISETNGIHQNVFANLRLMP